MKSYDDAAEFHRFFEEHHRVLARLAYLLIGDTEAADDLTADAFVATWYRWNRADARPVAHVRRNVIDLAECRSRSVTRERGTTGLIGAEVRDQGDEPDVPAVPGIRVTLRRLPPRRRACVALRCAFDLSEGEVATALGISARAVRKETSRAVAAFEKALNARRSPKARTDGRAAGGGRANQPPDWLRFALYREAYAHEPDRARMRARVAAALRARVTRRARYRMAAAGGAAVAVAVVAVITLPRITGSDAPTASAGGALSPASPAPVVPQPNGSAMTVTRPGRPVMNFSARVDGPTNDYWGQDLIDVTSDRPLTGLRVTLRVARTPGARVTGSWLSLSPEDFVVTSDASAHTLVYRWTLRPGHTVPSGTFTFAGQYQHAPGRRDFRQDAYTVTASGGSGTPVHAAGHL